MKTIEQNYCMEIKVSIDEDGDLLLSQQGDSVVVDKKQASELIKVLQEWIDENHIY